MKEAAYLESFLVPYWLRPETALWRAVDCLALERIEFKRPILDLGCGDGLFSFLRAGGKVTVDFDVFLETHELDAFFEKADIYDHFDSSLSRNIIAHTPSYNIDVGFDQKAALIAKAARLGFYDQTLEGDANNALPFPNKTFETVFSNIVYWLENYQRALSEIARILTPSGRAVLMLPNKSLMDYLFYQRFYAKTGDPNWAWLDRLDRGRSTSNIKMAKSYLDWKTDFETAGLAIVWHQQHLSKTLIEAWDIGLRPVSPFLIKMANKLTRAERTEIKSEWIEAMLPLIQPLCTLDWITDAQNPPAFHCFVLQRK